MNKLITKKKDHKQHKLRPGLRNGINRVTLKSHEFDQARSPVSLSNSSFNSSLSLILSPLVIETPSPAATFHVTERSTATVTLLTDTPQNLSHPATASPTNQAIDNMLETIEYNSIRSYC